MKAIEDDDFQPGDPGTISQYTLSECLDLYRKLQFSGLMNTKTQKDLVRSLKSRIISLVMPGETGASFMYPARSGRASKTGSTMEDHDPTSSRTR